MYNSKVNRLFIGSILGLLTGISYGFTILPWAAESIMTVPDLLLFNMARMAVPAAVLWIPGGAWAGLRGGARNGAAIMSLAGAIAGLCYAILVAGFSNYVFIGICILAAVLYGTGAGLLIGGGLPQPLSDADETDS